MRRTRAGALVGLILVLGACTGGADPRSALSPEDFVRRANQICAETFARFEAELPEPVGGAKPVGLGTFMREWITDLRTLEPPASAERHWERGLDLLEESTHALDAAEQGDPDAQSEALWVLQARAAEQFQASGLKTRCFDG